MNIAVLSQGLLPRIVGCFIVYKPLSRGRSSMVRAFASLDNLFLFRYRLRDCDIKKRNFITLELANKNSLVYFWFPLRPL